MYKRVRRKQNQNKKRANKIYSLVALIRGNLGTRQTKTGVQDMVGRRAQFQLTDAHFIQSRRNPSNKRGNRIERKVIIKEVVIHHFHKGWALIGQSSPCARAQNDPF